MQSGAIDIRVNKKQFFKLGCVMRDINVNGL